MVSVELIEGVCSYPVRFHAEDLVEELREIGIAAVVVHADRLVQTWDVAVPADDAVRARLLAVGLPGY
jgi:hypothetical protein